MADQNQKNHFIERILYFMETLEEKNMEPEQLLCSGLPEEWLSTKDAGLLRSAWESIRFMDDIPGGFFLYYANGDEKLIYANQGVLRMFQCKTLREFRELTGNSFKGIVHPDDLEEVEESICRQIQASQYDLDYVEYRIRRKDGSVHWVEDYGHFVHCDFAGDVFYVFLGDSTDERNQQQLQQERILSEALEKADLAVKAKNDFFSQISHEMRTPLNAIFGFTALAKISLDNPKIAEKYLNQLETASRQLLNMISEALDMSALATAAESDQEECDLVDTLQEMYNFLLPQAKEKGIDFSLNYGDIPNRGVYTNIHQLTQLVLNLANNAITYTNQGGKVSITLAEENVLLDSHAIYRLEVQDTGIGISEEFLKQAFEPFSREKESTLSDVRGIGLGLAIVKSIVDLLEGTITVQSARNKGSTFTVSLPFRVQPLPDLADERSTASHTNLRILLAEDNEINREIETELLQRMGFFVDSAEDGAETLEKVRNSLPGDYDLLLLDLQMPKLTGWEVASAVRKLPDPVLSRIPIIALSANVADSDRRRSAESGINVHLPKPMDLNILLESIEHLRENPVA